MMAKRYNLNSTRIIPQEGRTEVFFKNTDSFPTVVQNHVGAFLNTCGGVIHFGVRSSGWLKGILCSRSEEDKYRLEVDNIMKRFQPKVSPSLYRMDFIPIDSSRYKDLYIISIHVSPGTDIMYMDRHEKVMIMLSEGVYGPLQPQEIQRIAIHKYKQEILNAENLIKVITPFPKDKHSKKPKKKKHSPSTSTFPPEKRASSKKQDESRSKAKSPPKVFSSISTQTTPKPQPTASLSMATSEPLPTTSSSSDQRSKLPNKEQVTKVTSIQITPQNTTKKNVYTPDSVICIDDTPCNSSIITISNSSSESDCYTVLDETSCTPVRHPADLFASPDCSTLKKVTQVRPDPQSPSKFPPKTKRDAPTTQKNATKHKLSVTQLCEGTCKRAKKHAKCRDL